MQWAEDHWKYLDDQHLRKELDIQQLFRNKQAYSSYCGVLTILHSTYPAQSATTSRCHASPSNYYLITRLSPQESLWQLALHSRLRKVTGTNQRILTTLHHCTSQSQTAQRAPNLQTQHINEITQCASTQIQRNQSQFQNNLKIYSWKNIPSPRANISQGGLSFFREFFFQFYFFIREDFLITPESDAICEYRRLRGHRVEEEEGELHWGEFSWYWGKSAQSFTSLALSFGDI